MFAVTAPPICSAVTAFNLTCSLSGTATFTASWDLSAYGVPAASNICNIYVYAGSNAHTISHTCAGSNVSITVPADNSPTVSIYVSNGIIGDVCYNAPQGTINNACAPPTATPIPAPTTPPVNIYAGCEGSAADNAADVWKLDCIPVVAGQLVNYALIFLGIVAVIFIIYAGYKFITSRGDPKQVEGARKIITYVLIGITIILLSFSIIAFIAYITGVTCIDGFSLHACNT